MTESPIYQLNHHGVIACIDLDAWWKELSADEKALAFERTNEEPLPMPEFQFRGSLADFLSMVDRRIGHAGRVLTAAIEVAPAVRTALGPIAVKADDAGFEDVSAAKGTGLSHRVQSTLDGDPLRLGELGHPPMLQAAPVHAVEAL